VAERDHRKHRHTERLGGVNSDVLGEDRVNSEAEVSVLLGAADWHDGTVVVFQVLLDHHPIGVAYPHALAPGRSRACIFRHRPPAVVNIVIEYRRASPDINA